uniref:Uncharacterized protein n=1 Tax=Nelumbo nucifera TaxID=4432 RepID=A0A822YYJ8_NELNU|nr:TPA_asm: hypothetical protein HUJ06_013508 [Nelumbo nucifera]
MEKEGDGVWWWVEVKGDGDGRLGSEGRYQRERS